MGLPVSALIIGGLISLISAMIGIVLQHFLHMRRMLHESKTYPSRVLYDKQIEFLDALPPLLDQINSYITTIDVWLGEKSKKAKAEVEKAVKNTSCLWELEQLLQRYYMYLPSELLDRLKALNGECWSLSTRPDLDKTYRCINLLFETQNAVREYLGVDRLSQDLMKAMGKKPTKVSVEVEE
jgi:hypothetical protein